MNSTEHILLYQALDGHTKLEAQLDHKTVWLMQVQKGCSLAMLLRNRGDGLSEV